MLHNCCNQNHHCDFGLPFCLLKSVLYDVCSVLHEEDFYYKYAYIPKELLPGGTVNHPHPDDPTPDEYYPVIPEDTPIIPDNPDADDPDNPDTPDNPDNPNNPDNPDAPINNAIYIGTISMPITGIKSFKDVTQADIKKLTSVADGTYNKYEIQVNSYDLITVAVPSNRKVYCDDGFGGKIPFYVDIVDAYGQPFYCNGDVTLTIDNAVYAIYGLFTGAAGTLYIYIE